MCGPNCSKLVLGKEEKEKNNYSIKTKSYGAMSHSVPIRSISGSVPKIVCGEFGSFPGATVGIHLEL